MPVDDRGFGYPGTWDEYRRMVIDRLETTSQRLDKLTESMMAQANEIAVMRTKITIFAAVGGSVTGTIVSVIMGLVMHAYVK